LRVGKEGGGAGLAKVFHIGWGARRQSPELPFGANGHGVQQPPLMQKTYPQSAGWAPPARSLREYGQGLGLGLQERGEVGEASEGGAAQGAQGQHHQVCLCGVGGSEAGENVLEVVLKASQGSGAGEGGDMEKGGGHTPILACPLGV